MPKLSVVFNGKSRLLKMFIAGCAHLGKPDGLLHQFACHDVGVNDQYVTAGEDVYGHLCKCPPGEYGLGRPEHLIPPQLPYGYFFTPLIDINGIEAAHGRDGIGIHGGGSDLPNPFSPRQGWEYTFGCLRLQNEDNEQFADTVTWALDHGLEVRLQVCWP